MGIKCLRSIGFLIFFVSLFAYGASSETVKSSCTECHSDEVLPKTHEKVKWTGIENCTTCHLRQSDAVSDNFSVKIHTSHMETADCLVCHQWEDGAKFSAIGGKSFGKPNAETYDIIKNEIMKSWAQSNNMDNTHMRNMISCGGCHGKDLPQLYDKVPNATCLKCHGPIEKLVAKTVSKLSKNINVHNSKHFGLENECIVCHRGHMPSKTLCLDCHKQFDLNPIPNGEK